MGLLHRPRRRRTRRYLRRSTVPPAAAAVLAAARDWTRDQPCPGRPEGRPAPVHAELHAAARLEEDPRAT